MNNLSNKVFGIVVKPKHELGALLLEKTTKFFTERNITFLVDLETTSEYGNPSPTSPVVSREQLAILSDCLVVLGGDGTLISASRYPKEKPLDVIGINLGTLGFLTEILPEELIETLELYLKGETKKEYRSLLCAELSQNDEVYDFFAVNDIVLGKQALARIFAVNVTVNQEEAILLRGDGIIITTPGGSTAYSLAAGGSIIHPQVDAIGITPICPHSLTSRPLILPGSAEITLTLEEDSKDNIVYLTVDGQEGEAMSKGAILKIKKSDYGVNFIKSPSKSYFQILRTKLKWGQG